MENSKLWCAGSVAAILTAAILTLAASSSAAVGFQLDLATAVEQAADSHLPLIIYAFDGPGLDGARFAKAFTLLAGHAVILVIGTKFHGNAPTLQALGVRSFPTLILWRVKSGKKISAQEVARFSNCQLDECVRQADPYVSTGEAW